MKTFNVLFVGRRNTCRSLMAEAITNFWGHGRFIGHSCGSKPETTPDPRAIALLKAFGRPVEGLHPKGWEMFASPSAPRLDLVFTVCDVAADEECPVWPGNPVTGHWSVADPAREEQDEDRIGLAYRRVYRELEIRIRNLIDLPVERIESSDLPRRLAALSQPQPREERPAETGAVDTRFQERLFIKKVIERIDDLFHYDFRGEVRLNTDLFEFILFNAASKQQVRDMILNNKAGADGYDVDVEIDRPGRALHFTATTPSYRKTVTLTDRFWV